MQQIINKIFIMEYILRKDSNNNWHFVDVKSGSKGEQSLCRFLALRYLDVQLVANTPNYLVESAIRKKCITSTFDLGVISFLSDGRIMFMYGSHYM